MVSRRTFIRTTALTGIGLMGALHLPNGFSLPLDTGNELYALSDKLVDTWGKSLLKLQVLDKSSPHYGGILCPTYKVVHGRIGDTIYPFCYLAAKTKDSQYLDSAMLLYRWMENNVSQQDGSWLNEPVQGAWKGTTVFSIIALGEALKNHSEIMDDHFKSVLTDRLQKACDFVYNTFTIDYGNINYPISASYGLSLLGEILDSQKFSERGQELAHQALKFITSKDGFIFGEGDPYYEPSKKGCFSVDLGYNVEESLPSLVLYGLLKKDEEVLTAVTRSLQTQMEFMLPDGGWDNSWGTRNYKWTYWGSRTSDGCQPAYALMADRDPRFYKVALRNTELLQRCTNDGLLYGGPHCMSHHIAPSVHHTFCHIKALTTILDRDHSRNKIDADSVLLPRESAYGIKLFSDIQTWLIAKGKYRATVTGYDREYKKTTGGHASGGALTMLWHEKAGLIFTASMNQYQLYEAGNMQVDNDPLSMPLTPRIDLNLAGIRYMNIADLSAVIEIEAGDQLTIKTKSKLVDKDQKSPSSGDIHCEVTYIFTDEKVILKFHHDNQEYAALIKSIFSVISPSDEKITQVSDYVMRINKKTSVVKISSDKKIIQLPTAAGRIFNFVPGLEAIPLGIDQNNATVEITVA